ncbi:MAG TPA: hypothetical protein VK680_09555 [Solirubrobacteraceae bacterium]|jgi:hypothetical protein|nr:hypothetical protein [Solirubrobacteraceae bacterium]
MNPPFAVRTWHYLRLTMVALVLGLIAAVLYEHAQTHCFQTSISAYWYTPARGYFVAMLLGMSVCMVCLRGSTEAEDIMLNFAGMLAPVVAFASTPPEAGMPACAQMASAVRERSADIANNATAMFALGGAAILIATVLTVAGGKTPNRAVLAAAIGGVVLWLAALLVFVLARDAFEDDAHITAAPTMFLCIVAVVCVNAWRSQPQRHPVNFRNAYVAIAVGMLATIITTAASALSGGFSHLTIWTEVALIGLFALFWTLQTIELWKPGLRPREPLIAESS